MNIPKARYPDPDISVASIGLTLGQLCELTGLGESTVQNWTKRGFVPRPVRKRYYERQLGRILIIAALRDSMQIDKIGGLLELINGDTEDASDDIISEPELYGLFLELAGRLCDNADSSQAEKAVRETAALYEAPDEAAGKKILDALKVMAYAHLSSVMRERAENIFEKLKEKNYEPQC